MNSIIKFLIRILLVYVALAPSWAVGEQERVVVYGENHIFTIEKPENWILDKEFANELQLGSFFYPIGKSDKTETYFYAQGWDKPNKNSTLGEFLESNIAQIKQKFPEVKYEKVKQGASGSILNAWMYKYTNMGSRFKEEVIYLESSTAVITLVFSTKSETDYAKYVKDFDKMASSFEYLSSDPKEIKNAIKDITNQSTSRLRR